MMAIFYTQEKIDFLKKHYPKKSRKELTAMFNAKFNCDKAETAIMSALKRFKIKSGRTGKFEAGHVPFNAGTKGLMKPNSGSFKKGNIPSCHKPVGYERVLSDGHIYIKVAEPNKFRYKSHVVWEKHHGEIPKDHCILIRDGNPQNCVIENLELVTRAELCRLNHNPIKFKSAPDELKPVLINQAKLKTKLGAIRRKEPA